MSSKRTLLDVKVIVTGIDQSPGGNVKIPYQTVYTLDLEDDKLDEFVEGLGELKGVVDMSLMSGD